MAFSLPILLEYYFKLNKITTEDWIIRLFFTAFVLLSFGLCVLSICAIININVFFINDMPQSMFFLATLIVIPFLLDCVFLMVFERIQS